MVIPPAGVDGAQPGCGTMVTVYVPFGSPEKNRFPLILVTPVAIIVPEEFFKLKVTPLPIISVGL